MEDKFEDIKNKLIVDEETYPKEKLIPLMEVLHNFVRIRKDGQIVVIKYLPTRKILPLILCARFVGHKLSSEIPETINKEELQKYSLLKKEVFNIRLFDMLKDGIAEKYEDEFKIRNIFLAEGFLSELKDKSSKFLLKPNKQGIKQGTLKTDEKIKEEIFDINSDSTMKSLSEYIEPFNFKNFRQKTIIIGDYINKKTGRTWFTEGEIFFAYKNLGIQKPKAFHQMFLDTKKEKRWITEGEKPFSWKLTEEGKNYLNKLINKDKK